MEPQKAAGEQNAELDLSHDPGAARHGNFINYYSFNPAAARLCHLKPSLLQDLFPERQHLVCLDVGCNSGQLTAALAQHFTGCRIHLLGVDLDQHLIQRAQSAYQSTDTRQQLDFRCVDVMCPEQGMEQLGHFLTQHSFTKFDVIFAFSVIMWIHLNHGDAGVISFLEMCSRMGRSLVLEPQPWKCYRTAARRMKRLQQPDFHHLPHIQHKGDQLLPHLLRVCQQAGFRLVHEPGHTHWQRPIWVMVSDSAEG